MVFKRVLAIVLVAMCLCLSSSLSVFAETTHSNIDVGVSPAYEIAKNPTSNLSINGQTAFCTSTTDGVETVSITVEQTLEKYSGWFWIWNDVDNTSWTRTVNESTISFSNTKSGLSSGKYRLKSVFTLTKSNGETETIEIYSVEKTVS